jgi:ribosome-associated heat shock protein Hsp15
MSEADEAGRLDRWLFFARLCKSRSLAQRLCEEGLVVVDGAAARRPSRGVRPGTEIAVTLGRTVRRVRVVALGTRRGPAPEAQALYEDLGSMPAPDDWG